MPVLTAPTGTVEQLGTREVLRSTVDKLAFYLENNAAIDAVVLGEAIASIADYAHANNVDLQTLMTTCENNMHLTPTEIRPLKTNVMVDLETLGARPGCKVMSIGAVVFNPAGVEEQKQFYIDIHRDQPLLEQHDTIAWWEGVRKDNPKAYDRIFGSELPRWPMADALNSFTGWLNGLGGEVLVWGNGADFDNPILSAAYAACGMPQPWGPWNGRCYRTLKGLRSDIRLSRKGTHHNALDDAISQAQHAVELLNATRGWEAIRAKA